MSFPDTKFGTCERCGMDGRDQSAELTGADAPARSTTGNGADLKLYDGKKLCNVCINELKSEQESLDMARKHAEAEKFRGKAGFQTSVS